MSQPLVSILVPVYGVEKYIERCVVSLMEQTYQELEYIFVDDATPDLSVEVLQEVVNRYPNRVPQVKVIHHECNMGISTTRNTAVSAASGDYLWFVDSDDYIPTDAVSRLVSNAIETKADIVIFDSVHVEHRREKVLRAEYVDKKSYIEGILQHEFICAHWNKFYRKDFYICSNVKCVDIIHLADDFATTPRLLHQAETISVLHLPLYYYDTQNQDSYVHKLNRSAIASQYKADCVLIDYFTNVYDKEAWKGIVNIIRRRSITSLLKRTNRSYWVDIRIIYGSDLPESVNGLKFIDRTIYRLFVSGRDTLLYIIIFLYRFVCQLLG